MRLDQRDSLLHGFKGRALVEQTLQHIVHLLTDSECLSKKYGARRVEEVVGNAPPSCIDSAPGGPSTVSSSPAADRSVKQKLVWGFRDRKRYGELISELKNLVDGVENITKGLASHEQQNQAVAFGIKTISAVRAPVRVTQAYEVNHPAPSNAVLVPAELLSPA